MSEEITEDDVDLIVTEQEETGEVVKTLVVKEKAEPTIKEEEDEDVEAEAEEEPSALGPMRSMIFQGMKVVGFIVLVAYLLAAFIIDFKRALALFVITVTVIVYNVYAYWVKSNPETVSGMEERCVLYVERNCIASTGERNE